MEKEEGRRAMSIECETCADPNCTCGDCGAKQIMLSVEEHQRLREYVVALEASRRDLMGRNEELYEKIGALERGQEDLQKGLEVYGQFAEKFDDLSNCYDEHDVTAVIIRELEARDIKVCAKCGSYRNVHCMTIEKVPGVGVEPIHE